MCVCAQSLIYVWLWDPIDCSPPGSSVHGILKARILEWVAMPSSKGSSQPRGRTQVSCVAGGFFTIWATREAHEYWSGWPIPSPGDLPDPGIEPGSPALQVDSLPAATRKSLSILSAKLLQSSPTLYDPMDCSPPGSSVHGISQAKILEWVAIFFSRRTSWPTDWTWVSYIGRWALYH